MIDPTLKTWLAAAAAVVIAMPSCNRRSDPKVAVGGLCDHSYQCAGDAICHRQHCMMPADRDRDLLLQSSGAPAEVERPPVGGGPAIGGRPVRVRTSNGDDLIFAACAATERLVGGGCSGGGRDAHGWPSDFGATDTLGARWYCSGSLQIQAYALCQDASAEPSPPVTPARPGDL